MYYRTLITEKAPPAGATPSRKDYRVELETDPNAFGRGRAGYYATVYNKNEKRLASSLGYECPYERERWALDYIDNQIQRRKNLIKGVQWHHHPLGWR